MELADKVRIVGKWVKCQENVGNFMFSKVWKIELNNDNLKTKRGIFDHRQPNCLKKHKKHVLSYPIF